MIERYSVSRSGTIWRHLTLNSGKTVDTPMGNAVCRRGEMLDAGADRAYLTSKRQPRNQATGPAVRVVDLFAGCGGLSLGLSEACRATGRRFQAVAAVDLDRAALDIYASNFPGSVTLQADVAELVSGRFQGRLTSRERRLRRRLPDIDFMLAGPPCQGFSALNNYTRGDDPKNRLYERVTRVAEVLEPTRILIENVASVRAYSPAAVTTTVRRLEKLGYSIHEEVIALVDLGVPQLRRRHIVVATLGSAILPQDIVAALRRRPRDLRWAIGDLSTIRPDCDFDRPSSPSPANEKRMTYLREHQLWDLPNHVRPACHRGGDHSYKSMYGRLRWDKPAQTITSGFGSMGQGRYVHPGGRRTLTPHEAARLQCFPDWFSFGQRARTVWATAIGNAVPMKVSYVFGVWLLR